MKKKKPKNHTKEKIWMVISANDNRVIAKLMKPKKGQKTFTERDIAAKGVAVCHPGDTFHLDKGVEIALSRLFKKPLPKSAEIEEGDYVIGNPGANCYKTTRNGYIGKVMAVYDDFMDIMAVNGVFKLYTVKKEYFDLLAKGDKHE